MIVILAGLALWELVWKGLALWQAAKKGEVAWFVVMLLFNTMGLLPIFYLYVFPRFEKKQNVAVLKKKSPKRK